MRLLRDILYKAGLDAIHGDSQLAIAGITQDSRAVKRFGLYVAVSGTQVDGHSFIDSAIENGAVAIVCEKLPAELREGVTYVQVKQSQKAIGQIAANFYDHPSQKLKLIGVTGTNGKTSVATGLYDLYTRMGYRCGLISTVENRVGSLVLETIHTTPDAVNLQATLARMVEARVSYCFMEVSSHALDQERVAGTRFVGGIFTNITHDHLDYHKTFNNYVAAKKRLFDLLPADAFALYNADDRQGEVMVSATRARKVGFALKKLSDFKGRVVENSLHGLVLEMDGQETATLFTGAFNAYNLLSIYGAACLLGQDKMHVLTTLSTLTPPRGRFQKISAGKHFPLGIVDYAHTPDALENVLKTLLECQEGAGKLWCIVGCGGDRDTNKRPVMGKIATRYADQCIFTSDNPRSEDPETIIHQMKEGLTRLEQGKVISIPDRKEAIRLAFQLAGANDAVLVAGKGHETYQEVKGVRLPFDDAQQVREALTDLTSKNV